MDGGNDKTTWGGALTPKEVAKTLSISTQMAYNIIKDGQLPAFRVGSAVRVMEADLARYIDEQKRAFRAEAAAGEDQEAGGKSLRVHGLHARVGDFALSDVSFEIAAGETLGVLGGSGSGKTTLLNAIAGLTPTDGGTIEIGDRDVKGVAVADRRLGYVFQDYALFPNLSARGNIEFPMRVRRLDDERINDRIVDICRELELDTRLLPSPIDRLSEGIKQLVAIGREQAHLFHLLLLDEPMSNMDATVRTTVRVFLKTYVQKLGKTTVIALADPADAMLLSDRLLIVHEGRAVQMGTPMEVYERPAHPASLVMLSRLGVNAVDGAGGDERAVQGGIAVPEDDRRTVFFRPEDVRVVDDGGIPVRVVHRAFVDAAHELVTVDVKEGSFTTRGPAGPNITLLLPVGTPDVTQIRVTRFYTF